LILVLVVEVVVDVVVRQILVLILVLRLVLAVVDVEGVVARRAAATGVVGSDLGGFWRA